MKPHIVILWLLVQVTICVVSDTSLLKSWHLQSSAKVSASGEDISSSNFDDSTWYPVTCPATVFAGLLQNGVYKDVFYGVNLEQVDSTLFDTPWWYRAQFNLDPAQSKSRVRLLFKGLNYRSNVYLNGHQIGSTTDTVGPFRYFDFDITDIAVFSLTNPNVVAVSVTKPIDSILFDNTTDLAITFVDWAPTPPDMNMGLWREVLVVTTGPVSIGYPMVQTKLSSLHMAHLVIMAEVVNALDSPVDAVVTATIDGAGSISTSITLKANEIAQVFFKNDSYPSLNIENPVLWWPWQMGEPHLHRLDIQVTINGTDTPSDTLSANFGIREATSELTDDGYRLYRINGQRLLIRGAGWSPDLFQRSTPEWQEFHFKYIKDMNLNTVRLEGKFENDHFFDLADTYGILIMPGWCCCDAWQHWNHWKDEQFLIAKQSQITQAKRLRIHPSVFVFVYSSDELPPEKVEKVYLEAFSESFWPNPVLSAASDRTSSITGPTGVKMSGPYSWEPPNYWLTDTSSVGGAFGFLTEGGPGENPLSFESFSLTVPSDKLWPINNFWDYHCGLQSGNFGSLKYFTTPLEARYGKATGVEDYLEKSQVMAYEGHRAMFEGYGRNKYTSTGVIQWMLNTAFPEMIWHLYDYYFNPSSTYFATKKACEPLHIQYSYDDQSVWVINSLYVSHCNVQAMAQVYSIDANLLYNHTVTIPCVAPDAAVLLFTLPSTFPSLSTTYFVRLSLTNQTSGNELSQNVYWLSTVPDVLDWDKSTWYNTPCLSYGNLQLLLTLPKVTLVVNVTIVPEGEGGADGGHPRMVPEGGGEVVVRVTVGNPGPGIAFFIHVRLVEDGVNVWPIIWDDNYFSLWPNETRTVEARYEGGSEEPEVLVDVWNNISGGK